ncbi:MAG TPA: alpha/beta hydrolase [Dehalococcoidia bacterium]|nr:alpha/beta hydrolase [Dehalococcoidia bacterium]
MTIQTTGYQEKTIEARGLRFHYLEWGRPTSPPMIVLHGLTGLARMWDVFCDAFQDEYRVFALDQRGHGDTQWPDPPSYAGDDYVEDVRALADLWGLDRFVLIGLSMGAHNTLGFASKYPDRVVKAVPIDIPPAMQRRQEGPPSGERRGVEQPAQTEFDSVEEMFRQARQLNQIASDEMIRHRVTNNARQLSSGKWTWKYSPDAPRLWRPEDLWDRLPRITAPTLVVRGGVSNVLTQEVAEKEAAAIPNGRLVVIEGSGHPVPMDRPRELEAEVRAFLRE